MTICLWQPLSDAILFLHLLTAPLLNVYSIDLPFATILFSVDMQINCVTNIIVSSLNISRPNAAGDDKPRFQQLVKKYAACIPHADVESMALL